MSKTTVNQHHVWQYHLKAWANKKDQVWCLQQGKQEPYSSHTRNIASERFFYEFQELTEADERALEWVINRSTDENLRKLNQGWVNTLQTSFKLRKKLTSFPLNDEGKAEVERVLVDMDKTLGEDFHTGMEDRGRPSIDALRVGDTSFYLTDGVQTMHFIQFVCLQYFRTAKMRDAMMAIPLDLPHDMKRTWPIETFIYATNLGTSLYADRRRYRIVILNNTSTVPFITGDQPVINILTENDRDIKFYYPLTPSRAFIYTASKDRFTSQHRNVGMLEVENYNYQIYRRSGRQIYGNDKSYLTSFLNLPKGELI